MILPRYLVDVYVPTHPHRLPSSYGLEWKHTERGISASFRLVGLLPAEKQKPGDVRLHLPNRTLGGLDPEWPYNLSRGVARNSLLYLPVADYFLLLYFSYSLGLVGRPGSLLDESSGSPIPLLFPSFDPLPIPPCFPVFLLFPTEWPWPEITPFSR